MASQNVYIHHPSARITITMDREIIIDQQPMTERELGPLQNARTHTHIAAARLRVISRG